MLSHPFINMILQIKSQASNIKFVMSFKKLYVINYKEQDQKGVEIYLVSKYLKKHQQKAKRPLCFVTSM